jgi:hypothetical protein
MCECEHSSKDNTTFRGIFFFCLPPPKKVYPTTVRLERFIPQFYHKKSHLSVITIVRWMTDMDGFRETPHPSSVRMV